MHINKTERFFLQFFVCVFLKMNQLVEDKLSDFISIGTFKTDSDFETGENDLDPLDVETQRLVLEANANGSVILRRKQYGDRSQLWRMTSDGQLQHEGNKTSKCRFTIILLKSLLHSHLYNSNEYLTNSNDRF